MKMNNQLPTRFDFSLEKEDDGSYFASGEVGCGKDTDARSAIAIAVMASMIEFIPQIVINGETYFLEEVLDGSVTFNPEPKVTQNQLEGLISTDGLTYQQANRFASSNEMRNLRLVDGMWYADDQPYLIDEATYLLHKEQGHELGEVKVINGEWWVSDKPYLIDRHTYLAAEREGDLK